MQSAPTACADTLATFFWKGDTPPTVGDVSWQRWEYEESIPSSIIAAAEKLTDKLTRVPAVQRECVLLPACTGLYFNN